MKHRRILAVLLVAGALALAGCGEVQATAAAPQPARLIAVPGSQLHQVVLSQLAMTQLGVQTRPVTASGRFKVVPLTAVIYDPAGASWTYTIVGPRTFVRQPIVVDHIDGDQVFLTSGPSVGTPVVTVGAPELLGTEYGVGEE